MASIPNNQRGARFRCGPLTCIRAAIVAILASVAGAVAEEVETITAEELALVKAAEQARIDAVESVYGAVVAIYGNTRQGGGSGVLYDPSGLALTNHHVVAAAGTEGWAGLADGRMYRWKLIGTDPGGDVAIIQLEGKQSFPIAPLGDSDTVRVGDWAMAMGNPFVLAEDQKPTVTLGVVSGVKRYQPGAGTNMLVYGNCIQVDSSINPGNSGGPLFNLRGQVIGINGRGSFKERGRVNVGLGYAISSNQIKKFLPDLLATKVAQHGTLDALFGDRTSTDNRQVVMCETINLDSPAATLGLELGDELVAFEGIEIRNANQFTNIISTLPAEWPAELIYRRDGVDKTMWVRLLPLPYQTQREKPEEEPEEKKEEPPEDKDGDEEKKDQPPAPKPVAPMGPQVSIEDPGEIRNVALNAQNANRIIERWREFTGATQSNNSVISFRIVDDIIRGDVNVGRQETLLSRDGRFRVTADIDGESRVYAFDGQEFWAAEPDSEPAALATSKALLNPSIYQAAALATVFAKQPLAHFGTVSLDGGDKSQRQVAYRLKTVDADNDWFYVWLSVFSEAGQPQVRLLKAGPDIDSDRSSGAVTYSDWRSVAGVQLPHRREFVKGLSEQIEQQFVTVTCEPLPSVSDSEFQRPADSIEKQ